MGGQWHTLVILGAADKSQLRHERQMSDFGCRVILHDLDHSALQRRYGGYLDHKTSVHFRVGINFWKDTNSNFTSQTLPPLGIRLIILAVPIFCLLPRPTNVSNEQLKVTAGIKHWAHPRGDSVKALPKVTSVSTLLLGMLIWALCYR